MVFSVIVPIYNVEKYLSQCINSVLEQTFIDYEIILVNDGSTDKSGEICENYKNKHLNIQVIHKENGGLSDARNIGLTVSRGEYIIYIDSDDYISDVHFLEDIFNKRNKDSSDVILYKFQKFYDGNDSLEPCGFSLKGVENIKDTDDLLLELVKCDAYYGAAWIKAIRRKLLVENNICFEKGLLGEDMEWYFHVLINADSISVIDKSYIAYRQRVGSISKVNRLKNLTDYIYILEKWKKSIETAKISDIRKEALRGALAKYYSNLLITYIRTQDKKKA